VSGGLYFQIPVQGHLPSEPPPPPPGAEPSWGTSDPTLLATSIDHGFFSTPHLDRRRLERYSQGGGLSPNTVIIIVADSDSLFAWLSKQDVLAHGFADDGLVL